MVLLKGYLALSDQEKIVERCRELGVGDGGFYQPGYGEGSKMHLKMMCLGKNWDPDTSQYGDQRPFDGAKPPEIPPEFHNYVRNALRDSNAFFPDNSLPSISPDICIVNFYSQSGRLGLHQDKDESEDSLGRGLPVVSFSIGDSADFLYGDHRDVDKAHKLQLQSGDVLIFGGPSRHVFHGVTAIHPSTAPTLLLQHTNLRPGRLNLTFRQY
uniref:DNA N(6)-methyladenine demethylase n=2 Tax=Cajanus cajan TaxID=3821 RepID=A0A151TYA4_CAJCA|nr:Alpha-ketoglutarate-dependent dioxygenase alkB isogeny [Cajanus cajan]